MIVNKIGIGKERHYILQQSYINRNPPKTDINKTAIKHFLYTIPRIPSVKAVLKPTQAIYGIYEWGYQKHHMKKYETMNGGFDGNLKKSDKTWTYM